MTDDPAATNWTRGQTAAFDAPRGAVEVAPDAASPTRSEIDGSPSPDETKYASLDRRRSPALGVLALVALIASIVVQVVAIAVASAGDYVPGTALAIAAIALSGVAVLTGLIALIIGRGRILGIISVVLGLLTNPLLLVAVLGYLG